MPSCSVPSCKNNNKNCRGKNVSFHRFPTKDPQLLDIWKKVCGDRELNLQHARICSCHFKKSCFVQKPEHLIVSGDTNIYILSKDAVPTENLSGSEILTRGSRKRSHSCSDNPLVESCQKTRKSYDQENKSLLINVDESSSSELTSRSSESNSKNFGRKNVLMDSSNQNIPRISLIPTVTTNIITSQTTDATSFSKTNKTVTGSINVGISQSFQGVDSCNCPTQTESSCPSALSASLPQSIPKNNFETKETVIDDNKIIDRISQAYEMTSDRDLQDARLSLRTEVELLRQEMKRCDEEKKKLSEENEKLKIENNKLKDAKEVLTETVTKMSKKEKLQDKINQKAIQDKVHDILQPIFTRGQIKKLLHPKQSKIKWDSDDIAAAIALKSVSPAGYRYLRKRNFPLPPLSTLRKSYVS